MCPGIILAAYIVMINWRIGCSGYLYPDWKGVFYPASLSTKRWFEFYAEHFNSIELNTTFYRFPRVDYLRTWFNRCPADFKFSVKAPRVITNFKRVKEAQKYLGDFYNVVQEGLREKLGCVLFQFSEDLFFDEERLERIVNLVDASLNNVLEFRHVSWWNDVVKNVLVDHRVIFSGVSHPTLPAAIVATADTVYYRLHGVPHLYTSRYPILDLEDLVQAIQHTPLVKEAYIYFNNTADGSAVVNARELQGFTQLVH